MTPNTRKRKSRLAEDIVEFIESLDLNSEDQLDVLTLSLQKLNILDVIKFTQKPSRKGRKLTTSETRKTVWDFWHSNSTQSTNLSRPAKLKVTDKPKIQFELDFVGTVTIIKQRQREFYQNRCILILTIKELYLKYLQSLPDNAVSLGTFLALKPFYIRAASTKDIKMCVCKKHLHARWSIQALVNLAEKQQIDIGTIKNYDTFFEYLTELCGKEESTYIDWECVDDKNLLCAHIEGKWNNLKEKLLDNDDGKTTVNMQHFEKVTIVTKKGKELKRLRAMSTKANMNFILNFISNLLSKIIHHRNHLKHYRSTIHGFKECFNTLIIDIDFSENLSIPVKFEPQSLHWSHQQITVHSGLMKYLGTKSYHPYLSYDLKRDQQFVYCVLQQMLQEVDIQEGSTMVIESDNCKVQYKSTEHFDTIQALADFFKIDIIRVFGIPEHGKGEVDHVGGIAKTTIRREIATGAFFIDIQDMNDMLCSKFSNHTEPSYFFKEINEGDTSDLRKKASLKVFNTINGSSKFQVIVFRPNVKYVLAANRLCFCDQCKVTYGSCSLFKEHPLNVVDLKKTTLRSEMQNDKDTNESNNTSSEFFLPGSVCAIAAERKSPDLVWFLSIQSENVGGKNDSYGHRVSEGQPNLIGHYLEKSGTVKGGVKFKKVVKEVFFYKESVVYTFVNYRVKSDYFIISHMEYVDIINYVEHYGMSMV